MGKILLNPQDQRMLETRYMDNIHKCNEKIRKNLATYDAYDSAPERMRSAYSREEYKISFIDYWAEQRRAWVLKLRDVRRGYIYE